MNDIFTIFNFLDAPVYKHTPVISDPQIWLADKSAILEW